MSGFVQNSANAKPPYSAGWTPHIYLSAVKRLLKLRKRPLEVSRLGAKWSLHPRDWIDNRILAGAPFEYDQLNYAFELIRQHRVDLFCDCGANIGVYSILLGQHASQVSEVIAFEPAPSTFARLQKNVALNGLGDKIKCMQVALSDSEGVATLQFTKSSTGLATLEAGQAEKGRRNFEDSVQVARRRFDDLFHFQGRSIFFKIDVEGHALAVLEGMQTCLSENNCVLQVEVADDEADVRAFLTKLGYTFLRSIKEDFYFAKACDVSRNTKSDAGGR